MNYIITHQKLLQGIIDILLSKEQLTVKAVAERADVTIATAYNHGCREICGEILKKHMNEKNIREIIELMYGEE